MIGQIVTHYRVLEQLGGGGMGVIYSILNRQPEPPSRVVPSLPVWLDAIVERCLQKEPLRRYESAGELKLELQRGLETGSATLTRTDTAVPVTPSIALLEELGCAGQPGLPISP